MPAMIVGIDARVNLARGRGWGRYAEELLVALASRGDVELRVLFPDDEAAKRLHERLPGVAARFVPFSLGLASGPTSEALDAVDPRSLLGRVDVFHALTRFVPRMTPGPSVATVHDLAPLASPPFRRELAGPTRAALERIEALGCRVIAITDFTRREILAASSIAPDRIHVVHQGVGDPFASAGRPAPSRASAGAAPRQLLYVGGAGANKNVAMLLEAAERLCGAGEASLVLVGDPAWGYDELFEKVFGDAPLPGWLDFRGYVGETELMRLYRTSAALVFPSLHEGFGLPVLEAMSVGAPVCCSDIPALREVAGDAATYFAPRDPESLEAAVRRVLHDPGRARARAERGRRRAARFAWEETARRTFDVYRRAVA